MVDVPQVQFLDQVDDGPVVLQGQVLAMQKIQNRHRPCLRRQADQSTRKHGEFWVRHEGKTRVVPSSGTAGEMGERIKTATGLTRKERSVRDKTGQERDLGRCGGDNRRVIEVISMMRGGTKSIKEKNPSTSSGESEPEKVGTESATEEETQKAGPEEKIAGRNRDGEEEDVAKGGD